MTAPTAQAYYEMLWSPENTENVTSLKVTGTESLGASSLKQLEDSLGNQDFNETDYAAVMLDLTIYSECRSVSLHPTIRATSSPA